MKYILFILFFFCSSLVFAQSESAQVTFDDGLIFKHEPSHFKMKLRFRVQGRATYEDNDAASTSDPDELDFALRRMRLRLEGTVTDPHFFYKVQLSFSRGDMDWDNNAFPNILRDAVIGWNFNEYHSIFIGQTKLPGNRQRVISSGNQELVDRSLLNATFNIDRDIGVQSWNQFGDSRPLHIKLALSNGEGRASDNGDMGMSTTGRIEWLPLGAFDGENDYVEGDLSFETTPKLSLGTTYSVNKRTHRTGGQIGKYITSGDSRDLKTFFADAVLKYQGWALSSEFARRQVDRPIIDADQFVLSGHSVTAQASYIFSNFYSPVVRWTKLWPEEDIYSRADIRTQYTVGITKYINKHKVKLQADATYEELDNPLAQTDRQNWMARIQFEMGI